MNGRNIVLGAVALGLVALIIAFFVSAGDTGGPLAKSSPKPAEVAAEVGVAGEQPAEVQPRPVSRSKERQAKVDGEAVPEKRIELPEGARPEDGGLAFGVSLCDKMASCNCEMAAADSCAKGWISIKPEEYATASCMYDLACEDLCRIYDHPKDVACLVKVDAMIAKRIESR